MEILNRALVLGFCLTIAVTDSAHGQGIDEAEADTALLERAYASTWPKMVPLQSDVPQLLNRKEGDHTPLLLGAGIGALIGGIVLCPALSGSDTPCAGWVVTGGLLGALVGSVL